MDEAKLRRLALGRVIRRARQEAGLRQSDIGRQNHISQIEAGGYTVSMPTLTAIADALGTTASALLAAAEEEERRALAAKALLDGASQ